MLGFCFHLGIYFIHLFNFFFIPVHPLFGFMFHFHIFLHVMKGTSLLKCFLNSSLDSFQEYGLLELSVYYSHFTLLHYCFSFIFFHCCSCSLDLSPNKVQIVQGLMVQLEKGHMATEALGSLWSSSSPFIEWQDHSFIPELREHV